MRREEAIILALQIVNTCYSYTDSCKSCPFNLGTGCIVGSGNDIPQEWEVNHIIDRGVKKC